MTRLLIFIFIMVLFLSYITNSPSLKENTQSTSVSPSARHRTGTTRDWEFQNAYEEAVANYDVTHPALPPGLVLPNGQTVAERVFSEQNYGK